MERIFYEEVDSPKEFAGFWLRFVAYLIDSIVVQIAQAFVISPILTIFGLTFGNFDGLQINDLSGDEGFAFLAAFFSVLTGTLILTTAIQILYFALMNSSSKQATLGKMALGLKVTDIQGERLDMGKALLRELAKIVSSFTFLVGYIMAGFTEKKQALHDIIASTLVVKG